METYDHLISGDEHEDSENNNNNDNRNDNCNDGTSATPAKRQRRTRYRVACLPCQRKKCKCDGGAPCTSCQQRGIANCEYGPVKFKDGSVAQLEYADLKQRVMELEAKMRRIDTLLPPDEPPPIQATRTTKRKLSMGVSEEPIATTSYVPPDLSLPTAAPYEESSSDIAIRDCHTDNEAEDRDFENATETAALLLEEKAMGREQYGPLGGSRTVILGSLKKTSRDGGTASSPHGLVQYLNHSASTQYQASSSFSTDITRKPRDEEVPRTNTQVDSIRQGSLNQIIAVLPSQRFGDYLVAEFLDSFDWVYKVLHRGLFLNEVQQLWRCIHAGMAHEIDPAWLAIFLTVISWPSTTDSVRRYAPTVYNTSEDDLEQMAQTWVMCAEQAILLAHWSATPQMRVIQAQCLLMNYQEGKCAYPSMGNSSFYVKLAATIRLAQLLKIDKVEEQDDTWLNEDAAFPHGPSVVKIETARRVWALLLASDAIFNSQSGKPSILKDSYNTLAPRRFNDEDLGRATEAVERPQHELTDVDFHTVRMGLARFQQAVNDFWGSTEKDYNMVQGLDYHLEETIDLLPVMTQSSNGRNKAHHRSVCLCVLNNRRLRLHRPFLLRGLRDPAGKYGFSATQCIVSATTICSALDAIVDGQKTDVFWYIFSQLLAAITCIFVDHFWKLMTRAGRVKISLNNPSVISAQRFYNAGCKSTVPSVVQAARRGQTVLDALVQYEDELRRDVMSANNDHKNIEQAVISVLQRAAQAVEQAGMQSAVASPSIPYFLSEFLSLDGYDTAVPQHGISERGALDQALPDFGSESLLGQNGLVDWSSILTDPGLFGP